MNAPLTIPARDLFALGDLATTDPPIAAGAPGCQPYQIVLAHPTVPRSWPIPSHADIHLPISSAALKCVLARHMWLRLEPGQVPELIPGPEGSNAWALMLGAGDNTRWFSSDWARGTNEASFQYEVPALSGVTGPSRALIAIFREFARMAMLRASVESDDVLEGCDR